MQEMEIYHLVDVLRKKEEEEEIVVADDYRYENLFLFPSCLNLCAFHVDSGWRLSSCSLNSSCENDDK